MSAVAQNLAVAKLPGQRRQDLDHPAARIDFQTHGRRQHGALAGEARQKLGMVGWIFRHQHQAFDRLRRVGMRLIFGVPEILRMMLLAGEKPIIADFRLGMGSMGLSIGFGRSTGMADVLTKPVDDIRPRVIDAELAVHQSGLRALLSSARPAETALEYSPDAAMAVVRALRTMGKPAVFDLGSGLSPVTFQLQQEMDQLVIVVDPVLVTLNMARELLQEIDASRPDPNRIHVVVVNRAAASAPPSWTEVEQMLGREIRAVISLASELVSQSLQASVPAVMFQPTAIASSQMIKLAEDLHNRSRLLAGGEVPS